jgi:hypothetical protein
VATSQVEGAAHSAHSGLDNAPRGVFAAMNRIKGALPTAPTGPYDEPTQNNK